MALAASADSNIQAGISDYRQESFDQAEINFSNAQKKQPDNPKLNYNLANSQYKNGKFQEALKSYGQANANESTPDLKLNSLYNSGNALFRMGKMEESIAAYKKVLEMNPGDMDAKFNLEFVREQLQKKDQQDKKQNRQPDEDAENSENPEQSPSPENNGDDQQEDSAQKGNQEPPPPEDPRKNSDPASPEQENAEPNELAVDPENPISKDQAERWLSGLNEDLKKFSQKQAQKEGGKVPATSRDW